MTTTPTSLSGLRNHGHTHGPAASWRAGLRGLAAAALVAGLFSGCGGELEQPNINVNSTAQGITVSGYSHYCSISLPGGKGWGLAWNGPDPCKWLFDEIGIYGAVERAGLFSAYGTNTVVMRCGMEVGMFKGIGTKPLEDAYDSAKKNGYKGCVFTAAPQELPIFTSPLAAGDILDHSNGFDFARYPYNTLDVSQFGQTGSTNAKIVDYQGREVTRGDEHDAHDWGAKRGTKLLAVADGRVRVARFFDTHCMDASQPDPCIYSDGPIAGEVYIEHTVERPVSTYNEVFVSGYFHMINIFVKDGDWVKQGDVIGEVGNVGWSDGPHLHFATIRETNTATAYKDSFTIDAGGNNGGRICIDPYGFIPPQGFDPWAYLGYVNKAGALSINLWMEGGRPPLGEW